MRPLERCTGLRKFLSTSGDCTRLEVDEVAKWFFEVCEKDSYEIEDFTSLVSPWEMTYIEYKMPSKLNVGGNIQSLSGMIDYVMCLCLCIDVEEQHGIEAYTDLWIESLVEEVASVNLTSTNTHPMTKYDRFKRAEERPARWLAYYDFSVLMRYSNKPFSVGVIGFTLDKLGVPLDDGFLIPSPNLLAMFDAEAINASEYVIESALSSISQCFFFSLSLLHCKNVVVRDYKTKPRKGRRRGHSGFHFKTLEVDPMREQIRYMAQSDGEPNGIGRALHTCRGHFRTYTEEAPLFGRVVGTFWVPAHMRGYKRYGEIVKDYKVLYQGE